MAVFFAGVGDEGGEDIELGEYALPAIVEEGTVGKDIEGVSNALVDEGDELAELLGVCGQVLIQLEPGFRAPEHSVVDEDQRVRCLAVHPHRVEFCRVHTQVLQRTAHVGYETCLVGFLHFGLYVLHFS